jgi:hypothetical protein
MTVMTVMTGKVGFMNLKNLLLVGSLLALAGCNLKSTSGIPDVGVLNMSQKARFAALADTVADTTQFKPSAPAGSSANAVPEGKAKLLKMLSAQCEFKPEKAMEPNPLPKTSIFKSRFSSQDKVAADKSVQVCPIHFVWETATTQTLDDAGQVKGRLVEFNLHYEPAADEARAGFDVQAYDFKSRIDSKITVTGSSKQEIYSGSGQGNVVLTTNGKTQTVSLGQVIYGKTEGDVVDLTYNNTIVFKDGMIVAIGLLLKRPAAGAALVTTCMMNGEAVDAKECVASLVKLGFETRIPSKIN